MTTSTLPDDYGVSAYDARGQLIRYDTSDEAGGQSRLQRFYNGDGREVKQKKTVYAEDPNATTWPFGSWTAEPATYFIRSAVLGGEVVSEVNSRGRRIKNFVRAAGALVAVEMGDTANAQGQYVYFDHRDASGMSVRSTTASGTVLFGEGYDGAPAELDPMGGNAGLSNPYIEVNPPPIQPDTPLLQIYDPFDGLRINGQRVGCNLDGISIGCSQAFAALESGSAIPAALAPFQGLPGFQFNSYGLGIYSFTINNSGSNNAPTPPGGDPDTSYGTRNTSTTYYFSISWAVQIPQQQTQRQEMDVARVKTDIQSARTKLTEKCLNNLKDFLLGAIKKEFGFKDGSDELKFFADEIVGLGSLLNSLAKAPITSSAVHRSEDVTDAIYNNRTVASFNRSGGSTSLNVGTKYFYEIQHNEIRVNDQPRYSLYSNSEKERVYTIVHEAIHSIIPDFSDEFFAEYISNGVIKKTDKDAFKKGSLALTKKIKELCP